MSFLEELLESNVNPVEINLTALTFGADLLLLRLLTHILAGLDLESRKFKEHLAENLDVLAIYFLKHVVDAHGDDV